MRMAGSLFLFRSKVPGFHQCENRGLCIYSAQILCFLGTVKGFNVFQGQIFDVIAAVWDGLAPAQNENIPVPARNCFPCLGIMVLIDENIAVPPTILIVRL